MTYEETLPKNAFLGVPFIATKTINEPVNGNEVWRKYTAETRLFDIYGDVAATSIITDSTSEYSATTYSNGDEIKIEDLGLKFKCTTDTLDCTGGNFDVNHPLAQNELGDILNQPSKWSMSGNTYKESLTNGSNQVGLSFSSNAQWGVKFGTITNNVFSGMLPPTWATEGDSLYLLFTDVSCMYAQVTVRENSTDTHTYTVDMTYRKSLLVPRFYMVNGASITMYEVQVHFYSSSTPNSYLYQNEENYVGNMVFIHAVDLGSALTDFTENRMSTKKVVTSDGLTKNKTTQSYDVASGSVAYDRDVFKRIRYYLMDATMGERVLHIGTGSEIYDEQVYFGYVKHSIPIPKANKSTIKLTIDSLSYRLGNPLIAPDSTDGYAQ